MKLRRMFFLLVLLLGQIGSVSTDAWMIWNHLRDFHGVEHVCRHECDVCLAHHSASVRCNCLRDHNEADQKGQQSAQVAQRTAEVATQGGV